ncbi:1988_t:CDS:2 [Ambispora leptoticha]|uniref:1988_t:CDS:1 n=1 Tax=Ambispora leptoticha TaxID=144679 RepID=A0A9N9CXA3_9GLOM|nr:1988_t:CDS:2 [Ambispora leptoticha]
MSHRDQYPILSFRREIVPGLLDWVTVVFPDPSVVLVIVVPPVVDDSRLFYWITVVSIEFGILIVTSESLGFRVVDTFGLFGLGGVGTSGSRDVIRVFTVYKTGSTDMRNFTS